jgi:hypothetical protein
MYEDTYMKAVSLMGRIHTLEYIEINVIDGAARKIIIQWNQFLAYMAVRNQILFFCFSLMHRPDILYIEQNEMRLEWSLF